MEGEGGGMEMPGLIYIWMPSTEDALLENNFLSNIELIREVVAHEVADQ